MAAPALSKAEYLRRYESGPAAGPRRRRAARPRPRPARAGMRIVDDDVSWSSLAAAPDGPEEEEDEGDMPVVAEFVDERPDEVKLMEQFRSNAKWKLLGEQNEDSQGSELSGPATFPARKRHDSPEPSPPRQKRHDSPDSPPAPQGQWDVPELSAPWRQRHDSPDLSPPRRQRHDSPEPSPPRQKCHNSPELPAPRKKRHDSPDLSPPRRKRHDSPDLSPPRRKRHDSPDLSPPRRKRHDSPDLSAPRRKRHDSPDLSPPRRKRHDSPDLSPPRRQRHDSPGVSPPRRKRHDSPELSPRRVGSASGRKGCRAPDKAVPGGAQAEPARAKLGSADRPSARRGRSATPDLSPPRRNRHESEPEPSPPRKKRSGSPAQQRQSRSRARLPFSLCFLPKFPTHKTRTQGLLRHASPKRGPRGRSRASDSDSSPPRPAAKEQCGPPHVSPPHGHRDTEGSSKKANATPPRVKAGLVSAEVLRREQQELRRLERSNKRLEEESQHTETVFRDKSGRKRDLAQERLEQRLKEEAQAERDEQYAKWGRGLAQDRQQQQNVEDALREMQKPLARYIDDQDLDRMLREQEREGDPMAEFIKKRKAKEGKDKKERPRYNGPPPPLNRFNIWPGHRWDGVDRSNGFEQQRFARIADKRALQEVAYKWSVEDM
ncbi:BUD13 homolog [Eudromia elegans]